MELHNLQVPIGSRQSKKRVGRGPGSGLGTTAGRGTKGQKSRAGGKIRRGFEGGQMPLYRRVPKRGFKNINRVEYAVINVGDLQDAFEPGTTITPQLLVDTGIIKKLKNGIKVLAEGEITGIFHVKAHKFSQKAIEKIKAAGGTTEEL